MKTRKMHISLFWIICKVLLSSVPTAFTNVTLETETSIIRIGETVVLTCTVHEVENIDTRETRQWYQGPNLVCYNGKITNPLKYVEFLYKNKFKLLIYNVTEADLNRDYKCLYSFDVYSKSLTISEENFEYPSTEKTTELRYSYTTDGNFSAELHMAKVFPVPNCTIEFEDFQLMFEDIMYTRKGLYYEVHLFHQSHIVFNESTQFNVTCQLLQPYFITTGIIRVPKGGTNMDVSEDRSTNYVYILLLALGLMVALAIVIIAVVFVVRHIANRQTRAQMTEDFLMVNEQGGKTHMKSSNTEDGKPMLDILGERDSIEEI